MPILFALLFTVFLSFQANAAFLSGPKLHPYDVMHQLPRAESPGWLSEKWIALDSNLSNTWNRPIVIQHFPTGRLFEYTADFEQVMESLELGYEVLSDLALVGEATFVSRSGGILDRWIDDFHQTVHMARFRRRDYPENRVNFSVSDGRATHRQSDQSGLANWNLGFKWWLHQFKKKRWTDGVAVKLRHKFSATEGATGITSGGEDTSFSAHLGYPFYALNTFHASVGHTWVGKNEFFENWPRRPQVWMYDLGLRIGFSESWALVLSHGGQSPILEKTDIEYVITSSEANESGTYRIDPGWSSLIEGRTQQTVALQWQWSETQLVSAYFTEDFDFGQTDIVGNWLYMSGAPDVSFGLNVELGF